MPQKPVTILCAECEATIVVTPEMLDGAYACEQCGAAIDFTLYEPLATMIQERREAARLERLLQDAEKKRAREVRLQAERAEAERIRAEHEVKKHREMENRAKVEAIRRLEEEQRRVDEQRKHPLGQPPPYSFLNIAAIILQVIGVVLCIGAGVGIIIFAGIALGGKTGDGFRAFLVSIGPLLATFVIGVFYVALGEGLSALRDIAVKVHLIAEKG
mgnify:CR=1 FL=1